MAKPAAQPKHHTRASDAAQGAATPTDLFALAAEGANDGLWDWDLTRDHVLYSARWAEMLGLKTTEFDPRSAAWLGRVHPDDAEGLRLAIAALIDGASQRLEHEQRVRHADGAYRWMLTRAVAKRDAAGRAVRIAGSQTDVSDRHWQREQLAFDAFHDGLTNLPNRALFLDRAGQALAAGRRRQGSGAAVLALDVDRFKLVNDSLGHGAGDEFLTVLARRLESCLREGDTLARVGGDDFAILVGQADGVDQAMTIAERVRAMTGAPIVLDGQEIFVSLCIGIAVASARVRSPDELLRDAFLALYRAKALGTGRVEMFDQGLHARAVKRLKLDSDLRRAVERDEFDAYYQPIVALDTGRILGFEALARWVRGERGPVSPAEFIPAAEDAGTIVEIGRRITAAAATQLADWQRRGLAGPETAVNVNISAKQFSQTDLVGEIRGVLVRTGLAPGRLKLELTESAIMENPELARSILIQLRELGVRLCVDDFGTGYSSLSYLHRFPFHTLKIERSFIARIAERQSEQTLIKTIVELGLALGLEVVAEGVETDEQRRQLLALKCAIGQGYLFAPPVPAESAAGLLSDAKAGNSLIPKDNPSNRGVTAVTA
ncbi:MAG: putative bifunctional diguanylate cyclase/phosphodiesterase [Rhodospirillales bacterium]